MVFASLFFVLFFFIVSFIVQGAFPDIRRKNVVMLAFSLVFYAWGGARYVVLLLGMTFLCWFSALRISTAPDRSGEKRWLIFACVCALGILGVFKYTGFFLSNLQALFGVPAVIPQIALPIGISFYTFQLLSYVVDVYRGEVEAQKKYWLLLLYASLFHQCIAGPIVRYQDVANDILHRRPKLSEIGEGIGRFSIGLAKKAILANTCASIADTLLTDSAASLATVSAGGIWLGCLAFMLQIYLDFSAYSDMAIGMGLMCGFHYKENFNYPYISNSITDFWRRWHISLSTFFRDYVYIPLGGNRKGGRRQLLNMLVVWFLTGMWHGASWNFILWGLYYFAFLALEKYVLRDRLSRWNPVLLHLSVLLVIYFGWILFKFTDFSMLTVALKGLFGLNGNVWMDMTCKLQLQNNLFFLLFACIAVTPFWHNLPILLQRISRTNRVWLWLHSAGTVGLPVFLLLLSVMALAGNSYNPFLYFRF